MQPDHEVAVVGGGFSGIGTAIKLDKAGIRDWVMLEAGDGVGGAWHWNTYPGIGVDIPSFSYQFSFEQRSDWSRVYAPGEELKAYAEHCMDEYGLRSRTRLNTAVSGADLRRGGPLLAPRDRRRPADHGPLRGRRDRHLQPAEAAGHPRPRQLRRDRHALGALGPRDGPARQAGGDHRHRRLGRPDHPLDRPRSRAADRPAADPDLVPAQARPRSSGPRAQRVLERRPRRPARGPRPEPGLRRAQLPAAGPLPRHRPARQRRRKDGAQKPAPSRSTTRSSATS